MKMRALCYEEYGDVDVLKTCNINSSVASDVVDADFSPVALQATQPWRSSFRWIVTDPGIGP